ncbi:hypothetical protein WICANDRAFT_59920 [Wickerhamomyces anomalus NRRL Y-366-8]|uniref:ABC transporter domain-containing protein n=1 Tax=Wickerhamomyces anomalus (strain ATCC 58044 / CBS 1984 / NCYC 433 / NRRL Y-366-8) TaxID=683960 RepID=A0A1E3P9F0_WICAA|nr:uncharacterized protein WICANDRAFT_59920 [Wickerhamomyces anomalus NRRL Y-366-8]ODQ61844.1 hypothetical protein WICANDRAFT_59920 [Wickerhamomyces anomalus NRRL Y-366-8]
MNTSPERALELEKSQTFDEYEEDLIRSVTNDINTGVLNTFENLVKTMSGKTFKEFPMAIDPNDYDLQTILGAFVNDTTERGLKLRTAGITFNNVSTIGKDNSVAFAPTLADLASAPLNLVKKSPTRKLIKNINGFVNSGEMLLVLGRPGAGCSTFLKTISGETHNYVGTEGEILYNGIPQDEMVKNFKSDLIYNPEHDEHFPHLTVEQTLKFAVACRTPNARPNSSTREQYISIMVNLLATVFGLRHIFQTKVGNDVFRGVSGGERKRVSIAEALSARAAVYCWDNATRGLDASTALEYAQAIRTTTNLMKSASFVTIYQASENIYNLFDKVTVLYEGRQIYFGPVERARQYFIDMGYGPLNRQSTTEFLTSVTDPLGRFAREGYEHKVPHSPAEFEEYWLKSQEYKVLKTTITQYNSTVDADETKKSFKKSLSKEKSLFTRANSRYTIDFASQLKLLVNRGYQRVINDTAFLIIQSALTVIIAFMIGSLCYDTPISTAGAFSRGGFIFFSVIFFVFNTFAEMIFLFQTCQIVNRHRSYSFYAPSAEVIADLVINLIVKVVMITIFMIISYFLAGMKYEAGAFFSFWLFFILTVLAFKVIFNFIATISPTNALANTIGGIVLMAISIYSSFMIQFPSMHPWFSWIFYINPFTYGFESVMLMEFHGREMECQPDSLVPSGIGYETVDSVNQVCAFIGSEAGQTWVSGDKYLEVVYDYTFGHIWRNLGILIGFIFFFLSLTVVCSDYVNYDEVKGDKLLFKKGKVPDDVVQPMPTHDVESGNVQEDSLVPIPHRLLKDEKLGSGDVFSWKNLDYTIKTKDGNLRKLLDNVQGYIKPGQLVALMGESGAGKTTLLNVLSQRIDMGVITGDMLVNGAPIDSTFKKRTGYVQQQDLHLDELTVRESLVFAARMRRPANVPDAEKLDYVEKIIKILDMELYADAIVGQIGDGLNVEQRKKLSIGVELVAKPSLLLFLDEPSSGLDSQSSWAVVQVLRHLAEAGQAILCTIHQPSATLFEQFDRLLLLKKGGQTVYFGDIGERSRTLLNYFERNGGRPCGELENPAEYILESIGAGATAVVNEDWYEKWEKSPEYTQLCYEVDTVVKTKAPSKTEEQLGSSYSSSWLTQLKYVLLRTNIQFYRDPWYPFAKWVLFIFGGLFFGFTFWDLKHTITDTQNSLFVVFLSLILHNPLVNQMQAKSSKARAVYEARERMSKTFHWSALLLSQILTELPYNLLGCTIFFCSCYFPLRAYQGPSLAGKYYFTLAIMYELYITSFSVGVYYFSPDLATANILGTILIVFMLTFSGVVQPLSNFPKFWTFMYKASPVTYFVQNMVSSLIHGREVQCSDDELSYVNPPNGKTCGDYLSSFIESNGGYLVDSSSTENCGYCAYTGADEYIFKTRNIDYGTYWRNIGIFCVFIAFNILGMMVLYWYFKDFKFKRSKVNSKKSNDQEK